MRQTHLFISNASVTWLARALSILPQLFLVPYLIGALGEKGYGTYALVWSLVMAFEQLQASLQSGVVKYTAAFLAQGRLNEANEVVSSSFIYSILLAVVTCAGSLVGAAYYGDSHTGVASALVVVGAVALFVFPLTPFIAVIQSQQRYYIGALAETISRYLGLAVVIAWFKAVGPSVTALLIIMASTVLLARVAQVPVAYRLVPGLRSDPSLFSGRSFRLITVFGAVTVVASLCIALNSTGVRWLMAGLASTEFVAHLAIILMPAALLSQVIDPMTITVMSATSAYDAVGNRQMLSELLIRGIRYTAFLAVPLVVVAGLLLRNLLTFWVGPSYAFLAPFAVILVASTGFLLSTSVAHHMLKGIGRLWTVVFIYAIGLVIVPLGVILIAFRSGRDPYVAVTAGLAAGQVVCGCLQVGFSRAAVGAGLRDVLVRAYVPGLLIAAAVGGVAFGIISSFGLDSLPARAAVSTIALVLYGVSCFFFAATAAERLTLAELVKFARIKLTSAASALLRF